MPLHKREFPILDYDDNPEAVIQPSRLMPSLDTMPERVVMPFFLEVIQQTCAEAEVICKSGSERGPNPFYRLETEFGPVAVVHPGVGGPLAAAYLEEAIALGGRKFIACGGAGVLVPGIDVGHLVIPDRALRDEGTSYHYLPPDAEAKAHPEALAAIQRTLDKYHIPYKTGLTWTTDAFYRETKAIVADRVAQGCLTVEMEAASFMAVAEFRQVSFGQLLYGGDDLAGETWDHRQWLRQMSTRERLFWLAVEAVCAM